MCQVYRYNKPVFFKLGMSSSVSTGLLMWGKQIPKTPEAMKVEKDQFTAKR